MRHYHLKKYAFLSIVLLLNGGITTLAHATTPQQPLGDLSQPIQIQSNQASFEQALQQATHEGNVILTQGSHELHADKLVLKKEPKGEMKVIIATGNPATFKGLIMNDPAPVTGSAKTIYYYPTKKLIVFEGNATFTHQQDKFKGPSLSYQLDTQSITAIASGNERPTVVIQPRQASDNKRTTVATHIR